MNSPILNGTPADVTVRQMIEGFVGNSPANRLNRLDGSPIFDSPLVGYADGDDPLFSEYKHIIGQFHLTPREALALATSEESSKEPSHVSVICYILPIARATRQSNTTQIICPSKEWMHTRHHGEQFNDALRDHIVTWLKERGYRAIAPARSEHFEIRYGKEIARPPASNWSERHIQYAAGLGTFSINDGLITEAGIAMRCGSVVTDLPLPSGQRPYNSPFDYCLYLAKGTCGVCMRRCPAGAITADGHDKTKCADYMGQKLQYLRHAYPGYVTGCGLCQTGVPCEERIP